MLKRAFVIMSAFVALCFLPLCTGCGSEVSDTTDKTDSRRVTIAYPDMNADSMYNYIAKQLSFGPRVPGLPSHKACADWLFGELKKFCDTVYYQNDLTKTADGKTIPIYNLVGTFKPEAKQRMLLASHWDSRPWADNDTADRDKPIAAANDGASGVGVLLELARLLKKTPPPVGVDIIFFDAEDLGKPDLENSYCLGSQYWAKKPHKLGYKAQFGVLLDMVGGKNAQFYYEAYSYENAGWVASHVWGIAAEIGHGAQFIPSQIGAIIDDHYYVTKGLGIPMIDIIQHDPQTGTFAKYWHTHADDLRSIDKNTLKAVGNVISALVFNPPFDAILP